jgi:PII-like signaling protein
MMKAGDRVFVKHIDQFGTVEMIRGKMIRVKLDTGKVIQTLEHLVVIIKVVESVFDKIKKFIKDVKNLWNW